MNSIGFLALLLVTSVALDTDQDDGQVPQELDEDIDIDEAAELEDNRDFNSREETAELKCKVDEVISYRMNVTQQTWGGEKGNKVIVEADVDLECMSVVTVSNGMKAMRYRMGIYHVTVKVVDPADKEVEAETDSEADDEEDGIEANDEPDEDNTKRIAGLPYQEGEYPLDKKFSQPFYFIQLQNGTILNVQHSPDEDRQVVNIKKSLASLFQTQVKYGDSDVEEADASSAHKAHYRVTKNAQGQVTVKKQINRDDVERFPKGSGADPSMVDLEEYEEIEYRDGEPETISGRIKTSVSSTKQDGGHERDSAGPDSEEFESNSHLDETLRLEGRFTLRVKGRRKRRSPRSLPGGHDRSSDRLISSSLTAEVDERDTIRAHMDYMKQKAVPTQVVLEAIRLGKEDVLNKTYHRFLMLLDLEAHCEFLRCSSSEETPIANALVHYFYEGDQNTRMRLLSSLVASASQLAQQALNDVLVSPKQYGVHQSDVLHAITFLQRPSSQIINTVTGLCNSQDPDVKASAALTIGALARYSSDSVSDSITHGLVDRLTLAQSSHNTTERLSIPILLHALSNTRNVHAAEALVTFLSDAAPDDSELQLTASVALGDFIELESVVDTFTALLRSNESVSDVVAAAVIDILTNKLIIEHPPANIPHLRELESALYQKMYGHTIQGSISGRSFDLQQEHSNRSRRDTKTFESSDWGSSASQFNDVSPLSVRRSDKVNYPFNKAYMFGQKFGVDKLHLRYTVGAFGGLNLLSKTGKVYARAVAYAHAFGYTKQVVDIALTVLLEKTSIKYQPLVKFRGTTVLRSSRTWSTCRSDTLTLVPYRSFRVFQTRFSVPVLITTLSFDLSSTAGYSVTGNYNVCLTSLKGTVDVTGNGGLSATAAVGLIEILWTIRAGIEVSSSLTYYVTPSLSVQGLNYPRQVCLNINHGRRDNSHVRIRAYYQIRSKFSVKVRWAWPPIRIEWRWGGRKTLLGLQSTWSLAAASNNTLFNQCSNPWGRGSVQRDTMSGTDVW